MPLPQFHSLRIREVRRETADAISLALDVPPPLRDTFRFTQGQFLTLRTHLEGEEARRSYSICCGVSDFERDGELRVGIKRIPDGRFSSFANTALEPGDFIDVMPPDGRFFTRLDPSHAKHYVGFAGGSGITPMLALVKTTLQVEPRSRFTLIYGNRGVAHIMFAEELEDLKNRHLSRFRLFHVLSDEHQDVDLFNGVLDGRKCAQFLDCLVMPNDIDEAFICGPGPMMDAAESALLDAGVPRTRIHVERFGVPLPQAGSVAPAPRIVEDGASAELVVVLDGKRRTMRMPFADLSVLDAGLRAGLSLPYACKGGVCCTCRAKVLEGEVRMDKNFTLEEHEVAAGFVLTCQSHPVTEKVVVSYDER